MCNSRMVMVMGPLLPQIPFEIFCNAFHLASPLFATIWLKNAFPLLLFLHPSGGDDKSVVLLFLCCFVGC